MGAGRWLLASVVALVAVPWVPQAAFAATEVTITDRLAPAAVTVSPGSTVTWINRDDERHRLRSDDGPARFDSGNLEPGERFTFTFRTVGTYAYLDDRDREDTAYHGRVVVVADAGANGGTGGGGSDGGGSPSGGTTGGSGDTAPTEPGAPNSAAVGMAGRRFSPASVTVGVGARVTWDNDDDRDHTVTARDRSFDSGLMGTGATFAHTFTAPGTFAYLCAIHPDMTGTVEVVGEGGDGGTPPPADELGAATLPPAPGSAPDPGASTASAPRPATSTRTEILAVDFAFRPATVEIPAGSSVTFRSAGEAFHTATASDGSWDSGMLPPGQAYTRTFASAGAFAFVCTLHPQMTGTIRVTASGSGAPGAIGARSTGATPRTSPTAGLDLDPDARPATTSSAGAPATEAVGIDALAFDPAELTVPAGTQVRWTNLEAVPHTVTSEDGAFASDLLEEDGSFVHVFGAPGTYAYLCAVHPEMRGVVEVIETVAGADAEERPAEGGSGSGGEPVAVAATRDTGTPWGIVGALLLGFLGLLAALTSSVWRVTTSDRET